MGFIDDIIDIGKSIGEGIKNVIKDLFFSSPAEKAQFDKDYNNFTKYFESKKLEYLFNYTNHIIIPPPITSVYERIKNCRGYEESQRKYEVFKSRVDAHNAKLDQIERRANEFDYDRFISNPYSYSIQQLGVIRKEALDPLADFSNKSTELLKFERNFKEVRYNYNLICEQYGLLEELNKIFNVKFEQDIYCDGNFIDKYLGAINKKIEDYRANKKKLYYQFEKECKKVNDYFESINQAYIERHLKDAIFDNVNGRSLDNNQRKAVLTDDLSNLVVAGAGCGKTLTVCGKVKFLLDNKLAKPEEILLLSFSNNSVNDLKQKVELITKDVKIETFHALGLDILTQLNGGIKIDVESQAKAIVKEYFSEEIYKKPKLLKEIIEFVSVYSYPVDSDEKYDSLGELYAQLKSCNPRTLQDILINISSDKEEKETIKKERVNSYQELAIANYYYLNGVEYEYEAPYKFNTATADYRQYRPDFYLKAKNIYHEHYGLDKNGNASFLKGDEAKRYKDGMLWKQKLHKDNKTECIETFSYQFSEGNFFENLKNELYIKGIKLSPISSEKIKEDFALIFEDNEYKSFETFALSFVNLYKSRYKDDSMFPELIKRYKGTPFQKERAKRFISICEKIYRYYMDKLRARNRIDFDDMILRSVDGLSSLDNFKYKYVIVDEFQDISYSRLKFLKALIKHGNAKLFAVGDDWQSIYRFSGCDVNIFLDFKEHFYHSIENHIVTTYRNSQELQTIVEPFIKANPEQIKKSIKSSKHRDNPIQILYYKEDKPKAFLSLLENISKKDENASVLVLGRNNYDVKSICSDDISHIEITQNGEKKHIIKCPKFEKMNIKFMTVHGSKGLEDDYVIVINNEDNRIGFPNQIIDDDILSLLLSKESGYEYAEERRLFYVALTRTKNDCYLLVDISSPSVFIKEIASNCYIIDKEIVLKHKDNNNISCPICKTGSLQLHTNRNNSKFYSCSNSPFCTFITFDLSMVQKNERCPECNGFLSERQSKDGSTFIGCSNYFEFGCTYKKSI